MMKKILFACAASLLCAGMLVLPAFSVNAQTATPSRPDYVPALPIATSALDQVRRRGVLRAGVVSAAPWAMPDSKGALTGFEIDVARKLAADLGVEVEFVRGSWGGVTEYLVTDQVDVVVAGIWPNPRQALRVNFSNPYAKSQVTLFTLAGKSAGMNTVAAFNRPETSLAVREQSLAQIEAKLRLPKATIKLYKSDEEAIAAVLKGETSALLVNSPAADLLTASSAGKLSRPISVPLAQRAESFAVRRGDPDFLAFLNAWITYYQERGWLDERRGYWFSSQEWAK